MAEQDAFIELLRKRRSIRAFLPRTIEPEKIRILQEAVLRSPSSRNYDPWEFVFVSDRQKLEALSRLKPHGSEFLAGAAIAIAVCGDETKSDVWVEDCSIASILALLAAQAIGLGGCWVQVRKRLYDETSGSEDYVRQTLKLPAHLRVLSVIGLGYAAEFPELLSEQELKRDRIHQNVF